MLILYRATVALNVADGPSKPTEDINEESERRDREVTAEARCTDSFFDNERFNTSEEALAYMHRTSFCAAETPYTPMWMDWPLYLCAKVKQGRTCLVWEAVTKLSACQRHMIGSHMKVAYESDAAVDELSTHDLGVLCGLTTRGPGAASTTTREMMTPEDGWETAFCL